MIWPLLKPLIAGIFGGSAVVLIVWKWFGDVLLGKIIEKEKAKYNKEIEDLKSKYAQELETYRAQLDRATFVTRAHFEVELEAYKRLFEGLGEVRLAIAGTRPMMSVSPENETNEDRLKRLAGRLNLLIETHDKTVKVIEHLSPFYPQYIFLKIGECLTVARGEILDIQTGGNDTFSLSWYEEGQRRLDAFFPAYNAVTEAIRDRISRLAIIPRS
jgi:hypothetical protein